MTRSTRALDRAPHVELNDRDAWRGWLERNHATATGVWLVSLRRSTDRRSLDYNAAVEEALSFGWIDGQAAGVDEERSRQYFARRRARSPWSKLNKERFQRMLTAGRVAPAGIAAVERAKSDGSWSILDGVERLEVPADLAAALDGSPPARHNWEAFSPSRRRELLAWIALARRDQTRARRIEETAAAAQQRRASP
jgi:uncharacterized protein YdeI (YjbR/CyaY-like superfamily)